MARTTARRRGRQRGQIEQLPSGSLRVTVYAGTDPLTTRAPLSSGPPGQQANFTIPTGPATTTSARVS